MSVLGTAENLTKINIILLKRRTYKYINKHLDPIRYIYVYTIFIYWILYKTYADTTSRHRYPYRHSACEILFFFVFLLCEIDIFQLSQVESRIKFHHSIRYNILTEFDIFRQNEQGYPMLYWNTVYHRKIQKISNSLIIMIGAKRSKLYLLEHYSTWRYFLFMAFDMRQHNYKWIYQLYLDSR